jgi:hypothetical protein
MGYYLADGIYPPWATLISGVPRPTNRKEQIFTDRQASFRKDVERSFRVLQAKYAIIKGPARLWCPEDLKYIVKCIIILHNMGIKYEFQLKSMTAPQDQGFHLRDVLEVHTLIA